jgi:hypothetical protein
VTPQSVKKQKLDFNENNEQILERYIQGMVGHHYELIETTPKLHVLRELLMDNLFRNDISLEYTIILIFIGLIFDCLFFICRWYC